MHSAILAWAVAGAQQWREHGLEIPERVRSYTEEYRAEVDPLTEFLVDRTVIEADGRVERAALYRSYQQWALSFGARALTAKAFAEAIQRRGISDGGKSGDSRFWNGVRLLPHDDQPTTDPY